MGLANYSQWHASLCAMVIKHWVCLPRDLIPIYQLNLKDSEDLSKGGVKERRNQGEKEPESPNDMWKAA